MNLPTIVQERKQGGDTFSLSEGVEEKGRRAKKWTSVSVVLRGFFIIVLADSYVSART